jgi:hypothetical protein
MVSGSSAGSDEMDISDDLRELTLCLRAALSSLFFAMRAAMLAYASSIVSPYASMAFRLEMPPHAKKEPPNHFASTNVPSFD